jgi:hypothetical protein
MASHHQLWFLFCSIEMIIIKPFAKIYNIKNALNTALVAELQSTINVGNSKIECIKIKLISKYKLIICALRNYSFRFQEKIRTWTGIRISNLQIYPGSIHGTF